MSLLFNSSTANWSDFLIAGPLVGDVSVYMAPNTLFRCTGVPASLQMHFTDAPFQDYATVLLCELCVNE